MEIGMGGAGFSFTIGSPLFLIITATVILVLGWFQADASVTVAQLIEKANT